MPAQMKGVPGCCTCEDDEDDCEAVLTVTVVGPCPGSRIAGASVELYDGATLIDSGVTNSSGVVVLGPLSSDPTSYTVNASAVGFLPETDTFDSSGCADDGFAIGLELDAEDYHLCCCGSDPVLSIAVPDTRGLSGSHSGTLTWGTNGTFTGWLGCFMLSASDKINHQTFGGGFCTGSVVSGDVPILFAAGCSGITLWFPLTVSGGIAGPDSCDDPSQFPLFLFETGNGTIDCGDLAIGSNINIPGDCPRTAFLRSCEGVQVAGSCDPFTSTVEFYFEIDDGFGIKRHPLYYIFGATATFTLS
jgi:hypothetical protein